MSAVSPSTESMLAAAAAPPPRLRLPTALPPSAASPSALPLVQRRREQTQTQTQAQTQAQAAQNVAAATAATAYGKPAAAAGAAAGGSASADYTHGGPSFLVELELPAAAAEADRGEVRSAAASPPPPPTLFGLALAAPVWPASAPHVVAVTRGSPAFEAQCLRPGDMILAVNGVPWAALGCHVPHDLGRLQEALRPRLVLEVLPAPAPVPPELGSEASAEQLQARVAAVVCGWRARRSVLEAVESSPLTHAGGLYGADPFSPIARQQMSGLASRLALAQQAGAPPMRLLPLTALRRLGQFPPADAAELVDAATALAYAHAHGLPPMIFMVTAADATKDVEAAAASASAAAASAAREARACDEELLPGLLADYLCSLCPHAAYLSHVYIFSRQSCIPQQGPLRELCLQSMPLYAACCTRHLVLDTPARPAQAWCRAEEVTAYAFMPGGARALFFRPPAAASRPSGQNRAVSATAGRRSQPWLAPGAQEAPTGAHRTGRLAGALLAAPLALALLPVSFFFFDTLLAWVVRPLLPGLFRHGSSAATHRLLQVLRVVAACGDYARSQVRTRRLPDPGAGLPPPRAEDAAAIATLSQLAQKTQRRAYWNALRVTAVRGVSVLLVLAGALAAVLVLALLTRFFEDFDLSWQYALVGLVFLTPPLFVLAMAADSARFFALGSSWLRTSHARFLVVDLGEVERDSEA